MYKLLLCWRYLGSRYIALASIISVTLGVATMIVTNAVMAGFAEEMQDRIHAILADVVFESRSLEGFPNAYWHMQQIEKVAGDDIEQMTPIVQVPAMLSYQYAGQWITRPVQLVGIDERTQGKTSGFGGYLQHPNNREQLSWNLRDGGYDTKNHEAGDRAKERPEMDEAGWSYRRRWASYQKTIADREAEPEDTTQAGDGELATDADAANPFAGQAMAQGETFDPTREQHTGLVMGIALASYRGQDGNDRFLTLPGDDVKLTFPTSGTPPKAVSQTFTVVDFYESKMSEYDSQLVFVPLEKLQQLRGMVDPQTGIGAVTSIQIKLKDGVDGNVVRDKLRAVFPPQRYSIETWRDKQGPLLAAVDMETAILNVLLFLIIAVAGFGILAIFFMIVVEKTRDIGIMKAMGAPSTGIMGIFLTYGLSLGIVGAGAGLGLGLALAAHLNEVAEWLGWLTGHNVFDPSIYYFYEIPAIVEPLTVTWIVIGALGIAVMASVLPARRAAAFHPVEALRYE